MMYVLAGEASIMSWHPFAEWTTIGIPGSEEGITLLDEEHDLGARIALERDCAYGVPFTVTCGIYGWFFHTRFVGSEEAAEYAAMRQALAAILDLIPAAGDPDADGRRAAVSTAIREFVARFR